jgi:ATP-dependent DNA ligase
VSKWTFKQIDPQPARGKLVESMWDDHNYIAEEKYDGFREIAQFCGRRVRFTSRHKSVKDQLFVEKTENVPHLSGSTSCAILGHSPHLSDPPASLDGTVLDGEMIYQPLSDGEQPVGGMSKYVGSIMGSDPEVAVAKQIERGWLRYVVFDCLYFKGEDMRRRDLHDRMHALEDAVAEWNNPFATVSQCNIDVNMSAREYLASILARGGEGVILKHTDHRYGDKTGWVKVKAEWNAEVVIMGFEEAKAESIKKGDTKKTATKYAAAGMIGAIRCGQYIAKSTKHPSFLDGTLAEVATVSGMDDQLRRDFTARPKKYIGRVIEIKHNGREPTGRFRHPRFKMFRSDKKPTDCIYREEEI